MQTFPNLTLVLSPATASAGTDAAVVRRQLVCRGLAAVTWYTPGATFKLCGVEYAVLPTWTLQPAIRLSVESGRPFAFVS